MGVLVTILLTIAATVVVTWAVLLAIALVFSAVGLRRTSRPRAETEDGIRTLDDAVAHCRESGLKDWALVERAQRLVARHMPDYGFFNSFDFPTRAFERRMGYCWQRAGALERVLRPLGFEIEMVHAFLNRFPARVVDGEPVGGLVSGHVWLRVRLAEEVRDVCPGSEDNRPGRVHFRSLTKVRGWGPGIFALTYLGAPIANMLAFLVYVAGRSGRRRCAPGSSGR